MVAKAEQESQEPTATACRQVHIVSVASVDSVDPVEPGMESRAAKQSGKTFVSLATAGHHELTENEKWFLSARYLKLAFGTALGVLALFVSSYEGLDVLWEREWIWWVVAVPFYVFAAIFFARFVGSYLMRIWTWEIVNSPWVHGAVITLLTGVLSEESADELFAAQLTKPVMVEATSTLTSDVISSLPVQNACVNTVVTTLLSATVLDAVVTSSERLLQDPRLQNAIAGLIGNEAFVEPVAKQAARIVESEEMGHAVVTLMQQVLEDQAVRSVIKRRAESVAGDPELFTAGRRGFCEALIGPSSAQATGNT